MNEQTLNLRDIHLPEAIAWWPIAPGWWIILASVLLIFVLAFIIKKIVDSRQLKRDISSELETIKQQFVQTQNKSQLAKSLSILLRRANISYNTGLNVAGLTGDSWLNWLDDTHNNSTEQMKFQSDTGRILLNAPYLPEDTALNFDAQTLIRLCESWLRASHNNKQSSPT